jgi:cholinesterase
MLLASLPTVYSLLACSAFVSAHPLQARTAAIDLGYTKYQGTDLSNGVSQWLGMRYAAPPLGDLRFRAPKDPIADSKVNDADTVGTYYTTRTQPTANISL